MAGRPAGDRRGRAVLVRCLRGLGARPARAPVSGRQITRDARGLRHRARPVRSALERAAVRRHLSRAGLPSHIWSPIPRDRWPADTASRTWSAAAPTGWPSGSAASSSGWWRTRRAARPPGPRGRLAVRPADPDAALNLVLSHEADLLETAGSAQNARARGGRYHRHRSCRTPPPPTGSSASGSAGPEPKAPHPIFGDARDPPRAGAGGGPRDAGPLDVRPRSQGAAGADVAAALDLERQHPHAPVRHGAGRPCPRRRGLAPGRTAAPRGSAAAAALAFDILVPSTSPSRRQLAVALQAMWQAVGAAVTVTAVDFPVFQERLGQGQFDSYIGAWLDEPSPRGLADQWTRAGWDALNYGHYANPAFDALFQRAGRAADGGPAPGAVSGGDGHAQRRRAGHLPVRAGQRGGGVAAAGGGRDRSLQLDERARTWRVRR